MPTSGAPASRPVIASVTAAGAAAGASTAVAGPSTGAEAASGHATITPAPRPRRLNHLSRLAKAGRAPASAAGVVAAVVAVVAEVRGRSLRPPRESGRPRPRGRTRAGAWRAALERQGGPRAAVGRLVGAHRVGVHPPAERYVVDEEL